MAESLGRTLRAMAGYEQQEGETAGELLARLIDAVGTNPNALAVASGQEPSSATIRFWMNRPDAKPTRRRIKVLAELLGPEAGLLEAFGFDDMIDSLNFDPDPAVGKWSLKYDAPRPLTDDEASVVRSVISAIADH